MTPERWTQVKEAVAGALAHAPDERITHLAAIELADPDLKGLVDEIAALRQT